MTTSKQKFPPYDFVLEAAVLTRLSLAKCPNVVQLEGWGMHGGKWSIATRFESGGTLATLLARRSVTMDDRRQFTEDILTGLACVHSWGFAHLDIKPANILIRNGSAIIADFGMSEILSDFRIGCSIVQTLWYRAPEVMLGCDKRFATTDVWSVGCVFADMLHGKESPTAMWTTDGESLSAERAQLKSFLRVFGTPDWPEARAMENWGKFCDLWDEESEARLKETFPRANSSELDLLAQMAVFDPAQRPSAEDIVKHSYFRKRKMPSTPDIEGRDGV